MLQLLLLVLAASKLFQTFISPPVFKIFHQQVFFCFESPPLPFSTSAFKGEKEALTTTEEEEEEEETS